MYQCHKVLSQTKHTHFCDIIYKVFHNCDITSLPILAKSEVKLFLRTHQSSSCDDGLLLILFFLVLDVCMQTMLLFFSCSPILCFLFLLISFLCYLVKRRTMVFILVHGFHSFVIFVLFVPFGLYVLAIATTSSIFVYYCTHVIVFFSVSVMLGINRSMFFSVPCSLRGV